MILKVIVEVDGTGLQFSPFFLRAVAEMAKNACPEASAVEVYTNAGLVANIGLTEEAAQ